MTVKSSPAAALRFALLGAALSVPAGTSAAVQLAGESLEFAARIHVSAYLADTDGNPGGPGSGEAEGTNIGLSSNASYIRFAGRHLLHPQWTLRWQVEQEVRIDAGTDEWATRNTYLGFEHPRHGTIRLGIHDTPFKTMGTQWAVLTDTVADRRAILGAGAEVNNVMNQRARNSVLYINEVQGLEYQVMYATQGESGNDSGVDDNDNQVFSAAAWYTLGALELSAAVEHWSELGAGAAVGGPADRATGIRLAARQRVAQTGRIGFIFEAIDTSGDAMANLDRNAFGANASYRAGPTVLDAQILFAGDYRGTSNSGAVNIGLGLTHIYDDNIRVYTAFSITDNESNGRYRAVGGGHGDLVGTETGGTPWAISAGMVYRF